MRPAMTYTIADEPLSPCFMQDCLTTTEWPIHSSIKADPSCPIATRPCRWRKYTAFTRRRQKHRARRPMKLKRPPTRRPRLRDANQDIPDTRPRRRNPKARKAGASFIRHRDRRDKYCSSPSVYRITWSCPVRRTAVRGKFFYPLADILNVRRPGAGPLLSSRKLAWLSKYVDTCPKQIPPPARS